MTDEFRVRGPGRLFKFIVRVVLCWLLLSRTSESRARVAPGGSHLHLGPRFPRRADVAKQANSGIGVIFWNSPNTREFVEKYDPRASVKMSIRSRS